MNQNTEDFDVVVKASLINEILTIFNESTVHLPKKYVVGVEQMLLKNRNDSYIKLQQAEMQNEMAEKEKAE